MSIYGRCMPGMLRLDLSGRLTRGVESVVQDVYHALVTPRGTLPTDPEAGLGLIDLTLLPVSADEIPAIGSDIEGELAKDDRIRSSDAEVTIGEDGRIAINLFVQLEAGPSFRLVGPIADVRVEILNNG